MRPKSKPEGLTFTRPHFGQDFLKEAYRELKRVNWPTRKQAIRLTFVVIFVSVLVGVYVGILDLGFTKLMSIFLEI